MFTRRAQVLLALCGMLGPVTLVSSFVINPAPPVTATIEQLRSFAVEHQTTIVLGGWLQGVGSLLIVLFSLGLVHLAGATHRFAGWATALAGATILMVSLVEVTFYLAAAHAAITGDLTTGLVSNALIKAVQHVFLIAPALLIPLGIVLIGSPLLPRTLGYLALLLGVTLQVFGLVGLFNLLQPVIDKVLIVQALWFVAAATALLLRATRPGHGTVGASDSATQIR